MLRGSSPRTHLCNEACTVERNARQWHTDSLLSHHPAGRLWLTRDRLSRNSTIVFGSSVPLVPLSVIVLVSLPSPFPRKMVSFKTGRGMETGVGSGHHSVE